MQSFDAKLVNWAGRVAVPFSKLAIFFVYTYFGAIKVFTLNGAANPLVTALLSKTLPSVASEPFLVTFGVFEIAVGLIFIIPRLERLGLFLLALHLIVIVLPLFLLPELTWQSTLVPTLEGQYIIKNILLVAVAIVILASLPVTNWQKRNV